jgi:hypothetical protein
VCGGGEGVGRSSFLKKRSKKLLRIQVRVVAGVSGPIDKSFLLLFFKKEVLKPSQCRP